MNPSSGSATFGDKRFIINCYITGTPSATDWFWTKKPRFSNTTIVKKGTDSSKYTIAENVNNPSLTIKDITLDDDAYYSCSAENAVGQRTSGDSRLSVIGSKFSKLVSDMHLIHLACVFNKPRASI